jgi:peroxiredoxin
MTSPRAARVGELAPAFSLPDSTGALRTSEEFLGQSLAVVMTRHVH